MSEFIPTKPQNEVIDNNNNTTLVIDEVPSDLAYGILVDALNQGNALTHDELVAEIKSRTEGEETIIHFPEIEHVMHNFISGVCQECLMEEKDFHLVDRVIEKTKEEMLLQRNHDYIQFRSDSTPTPPSFHR